MEEFTGYKERHGGAITATSKDTSSAIAESLRQRSVRQPRRKRAGNAQVERRKGGRREPPPPHPTVLEQGKDFRRSSSQSLIRRRRATRKTRSRETG